MKNIPTNKKIFGFFIALCMLAILFLPRRMRTWALATYNVDPEEFWFLDILDGKRDGKFNRPNIIDNSPRVNIYIFDGSVNSTHPVFVDSYGHSIVKHSPSFLDAHLQYGIDASFAPVEDHPTSVSGVAAGALNGSPIGVVGNMNGVNIISVEVDTRYSLVEALPWSIKHCLKMRKKDPNTHCIFNISLGFKPIIPGMSGMDIEEENEKKITKELIRASKNGIAVVIAAGNLETDCTGFPQNIGNIYKSQQSHGPFFIVGGLAKNGSVSSQFNTDTCVNIYAPAEDITVAINNETNLFMKSDGTSYAAPIIVGFLSILYKTCPSIIALNTQLEQMMQPVEDIRFPQNKQLIFTGRSICLENNLEDEYAVNDSPSMRNFYAPN